MSTLKRIFKITGGAIIVLFLALFIWANWNRPTPGDKLKPKNFALYNLSNIKDSSVFVQLDNQLKKTTGVLATCIIPAEKVVSVVFYPDVLTNTDIMNKLTEWSNVQVTLKKIEAHGPTCPVAGAMGFFHSIKHALCIRN